MKMNWKQKTQNEQDENRLKAKDTKQNKMTTKCKWNRNEANRMKMKLTIEFMECMNFKITQNKSK